MLNNIIVADTNGKELRMLIFDSFDFEVGHDANDFQIVIKREEYEYIPKKRAFTYPAQSWADYSVNYTPIQSKAPFHPAG